MEKDWNLIFVAQNAEKIWKSIRWPDGPVCSCGSHNLTVLKDGRYRCKDCGEVFSDKSNTLFHGSKISIGYWMIALYLMLTGKGISSYELARKLQITQKTSYYMLMRLRQAFSQDNVVLDSELVAHDEVYIGGDYKNFCLSKRQDLIRKFKLPRAPKKVSEKIAVGNAVNMRTKKACFGMTDGDKCVLVQVPTPIDSTDIINVYRQHVRPGGLAVADCSSLYRDWFKHTGRVIHCNNHSKGQYVADNGTSSNMIENVFSWLERTNTFVQVHYSRAYTQLYLDEFAFRYNNRKSSVKDKMTIAIQKCVQKYDSSLLARLNNEEDKLYRENKWFDPEEFFNNEGILASECQDGGLVYRREDYVL